MLTPLKSSSLLCSMMHFVIISQETNTSLLFTQLVFPSAILIFSPHIYRNHPAVLGANHENLPKIVAILAEAIAAEVFVEGDGPKVAERVVILIRQVQVGILMIKFLSVRHDQQPLSPSYSLVMPSSWKD